MRYKLLAARYKTHTNYPNTTHGVDSKVVRQGEFTFAISGIRKGALKRKLSPLEVVVRVFLMLP